MSLRKLGSAARLLGAVLLTSGVLAACGSSSSIPHVKRAAFSEAEFGVKASPRVTKAKNPPKGGGRYMVGKPYTVRGEVYEPLENPQGYVASGSASWYGNDFHGRRTANGEIFSASAISCASPVLPLPSYVRVTNVENGRSIVCRVNDRGPYLHGRVMDLSYRTAAILGYANKGVGNIQVEYVGPAPLNGDDTRMLLASVESPTRLDPATTRLAQADSPGILGGLTSLFGYAGTAAPTGAAAAADALAGGELSAVPDTPDSMAVRLQLGVFTDPAEADAVAQSFAMLGAVDEQQVRIHRGDATLLRLTRLKPGVDGNDVVALATELGLDRLAMY